MICSLCCGQSRSDEKCTGCSFYDEAGPRRNYRKVPFYGTQHMADSDELVKIGHVIESTILAMDIDSEKLFRDSDASKMLELFFDQHHFNDEQLQFADATQEEHYRMLQEAYKKDLDTVPLEKVIKVMAAIHRSIQRRTDGSRKYLQFIHKYIPIWRWWPGRVPVVL